MGKKLQRIALEKPESKSSLEGLDKICLLENWLARNKRIFKEKTILPLVVVINAIDQLREFLSSKKKTIPAGDPLRTEEEAWLTKLNLLVVPLTCFPKKTSCSQLQFSPREFKSWLNTQKSHVLCFDGASKGNPGEAWAGGVMFSPRGQRLLTYSWNLGITTNNLAEAYAIIKGAQIAKDRQINHLIILGVSKTIIRYFIKNTIPKNSILKRIIDRTRDILSSMLPTFYHVWWSNNGSADEQANRAIGRSTGHLEVLGRTEFLAPP